MTFRHAALFIFVDFLFVVFVWLFFSFVFLFHSPSTEWCATSLCLDPTCDTRSSHKS